MCGICGEIRFDGQSADVAAVTRMTCAMESRGPDSDGVVAHGPIALGHRRLSIIDLSARGAQPMVDSDLGLTLVFNGCIYNYQDLRKQLQAAGYRFFSTADSEVVVKGFHHWGTRCVEQFKGMFAFAVADRDTGVVTLARDRLGIKPLYLAETPGRLRFASTVRALLDAGDVDTEIDRHALHHYMSFHSVVPAPRTIYRGVRKLPPATVRVIQPDGTHTDTLYWSPEFRRDPARAGGRRQDWQDALMDSLRTAVARRMVADVPVGVLLSGGIDSSIVVALLAEQGQHGLATFSIGFDSAGGESGDEYFYSDLIAKTFDTDHHRIHIDSSRLLPAVPKTIAAMSEPMVSHDCVAFYLLSEEVSKSVKVVQSGQGADEILAGYDWYPPLADVAREQTTDAYAKVFFDRGHDDVLAILRPRVRDRRRRRAGSSSPPIRPRPAPTPRSTRRCGWTPRDAGRRPGQARRHHDDGVGAGGAGAVPRSRLRRTGGHVPARTEAGLRRQGRAQRSVPGTAARRGHRPHQGLLPGARHPPSGWPGARHGARCADQRRGADPRSVSRERVATLLAAPNETRTTLGSNALWQLAVLEMWLQSMEG